MSPARPVIAAMLVLATTAACGEDGGDDAADPPASITLVAYESFPTDPENPVVVALDEFTADTGIPVEILIAGDTGTMLSKAALTAGNPEGDVMWGIDNTFLSRALDADVFEPYGGAMLDVVPPEIAELAPGGEVAPVDFGDVCVNYDVAALDAAGVAPPQSFADLTAPEYAGMLVVENPATSSPGLAFLLATIAELGDDSWERYWADLRANDVLVVDGWTQAYYEEFSWAGGTRPLVVSYGSSPPFEMLFAPQPLPEAPTGVVEATCFRQVEFAGILRGTDAEDEARQLVDFLLSERFQREVAMNLFVFPVNPDVVLEPAFTDYATIPSDPLTMDPARIDANRSDWIDRWTTAVAG